MYVFIGLLGLITLVLAGIGCSYFSARWVARRLGVARFHLFEPYPTGPWGRRFLVRVTSVMAPLVLVWGLFFVAGMLGGKSVSSNRIETRPGPARDAGLSDGDRIVAINGVITQDFDAIRRELRAPRPSHEVLFERGGSRRTTTVTPDESGQIKIVSIEERHPVGALTAARVAVQAPWELWKSALSTGRH